MYAIRGIKFEEIEVAFSLVEHVFMEFDAPDYSEEGVATFRKTILENEAFKERFRTGDQMMLGAFTRDKLIGLIAISKRHHISLFFVEKQYHRQGIGTALFNACLKELVTKGANQITLNASPYAVDFYHKLGFIDTNTQQNQHGIIYTHLIYPTITYPSLSHTQKRYL